MLAKRIIACLDVRDGTVVKGVNFEGLRAGRRSGRAGAPLQRRRHRRAGHPRRHRDARGAARAGGHDPRRWRASCSSRSPSAAASAAWTDAAAAIDAGADKVSLNTAALARAGAHHRRSPARYGSQAVVVAIDAKPAGRAASPSSRGARRRRQAATPSSGRARPRSAAPARSCSPRSIATAPALGFDCELTAARLGRRVDPGDRVGRRRRLRALRRRLHARPRRRRAGRVDLPLRESAVGDLKRYLAERGIPVRL